MQMQEMRSTQWASGIRAYKRGLPDRHCIRLKMQILRYFQETKMKILQAENRNLRALAGRRDGIDHDKSGRALVACVVANRTVVSTLPDCA